MSKTTNLSALSDVVTESNGNIGIGTSSPLAKLHVDMPSDGTAGTVLRSLGGTNNPGMYLSVNESTRVSKIDATGSTSGELVLATSGTERMRIDGSGRVTMPYQPAFMVGNNQGWITVASNSVIPWNTYTQNVGGHFNFATCEFTAPVAGTYFFHANIYRNTSSTSFYFTVNGAWQGAGGGDAVVWYGSDLSGHLSHQPSFQVYLSAGDSVAFKSRNTQSSYMYGPHSFFGGYLIG